jgi:O-Antigen ligase
VKSPSRVTDALLLATVFSVTFEKVHWAIAGDVGLPDILTVLFLVAFVSRRLATHNGRLPGVAAVVVVFFAAFLLVYLLGFFDLDTQEALDQFSKGLVKFALHFGFLLAAAAHVVARSERFYWRVLGWFSAGLVANAAYGVLQLLAAQSGRNLDDLLVKPLTGGASAINIYGGVGGQAVYRPNALTGDPNHLGIMLIIPLLTLTPIYLRLERGSRLRLPLAAVLVFLMLVELATLSRSGLLGLGVGFLVLALPYRRLLTSARLLVPLGIVVLAVVVAVARRRHFFETVIKSRIQTGGNSTSIHFSIYDFIPQVLHLHPLFGLGLNNFSVYYEFVTGKTNWGPHSFYVALLVETGVVGTVLFGVFLGWIFWRLSAARRLGRALAALGNPLAARVRPLAWGLTAALVGTMAANAFYLTMQFYYFYAFAALAVTVPAVFGRRLTTA